jgi:hypothetical protein
MNSIKGRVIKLLTQEGTSANGEWKRTTVVIETANQYRNTVPVEFFSEVSVKEGDEVVAEFFAEGREWKGKYYANLAGNKITVEGNNTSPEPTPATAETTEEEDETLPF